MIDFSRYIMIDFSRLISRARAVVRRIVVPKTNVAHLRRERHRAFATACVARVISPRLVFDIDGS
jgi:hypothetical protein